MRGNAADLVASRNEETGKIRGDFWRMHVSIFFSAVPRCAPRRMVARVLHLLLRQRCPSPPLLGALAGLGDPVHCGAVSAGSGWEDRSEEIATTTRSSAYRGFFWNCSGMLLIVLVLESDSSEGHPAFQALSCSSCFSFGALCLVAHGSRVRSARLELPSLLAGRGICRNRAAIDYHGRGST